MMNLYWGSCFESNHDETRFSLTGLGKAPSSMSGGAEREEDLAELKVSSMRNRYSAGSAVGYTQGVFLSGRMRQVSQRHIVDRVWRTRPTDASVRDAQG